MVPELPRSSVVLTNMLHAETRVVAHVALRVFHPQDWGHEMKYKKVALLPKLAIKNFAMETSQGRLTVEKWKKVQFAVEPFDFEEYCRDNFPDIFD